ncbi:MAG: autotransporter domain-containing protein [Planctomycetota bacterium]
MTNTKATARLLAAVGLAVTFGGTTIAQVFDDSEGNDLIGDQDNYTAALAADNAIGAAENAQFTGTGAPGLILDVNLTVAGGGQISFSGGSTYTLVGDGGDDDIIAGGNFVINMLSTVAQNFGDGVGGTAFDLNTNGNTIGMDGTGTGLFTINTDADIIGAGTFSKTGTFELSVLGPKALTGNFLFTGADAGTTNINDNDSLGTGSTVQFFATTAILNNTSGGALGLTQNFVFGDGPGDSITFNGTTPQTDNFNINDADNAIAVNAGGAGGVFTLNANTDVTFDVGDTITVAAMDTFTLVPGAGDQITINSILAGGDAMSGYNVNANATGTVRITNNTNSISNATLTSGTTEIDGDALLAAIGGTINLAGGTLLVDGEGDGVNDADGVQNTQTATTVNVTANSAINGVDDADAGDDDDVIFSLNGAGAGTFNGGTGVAASNTTLTVMNSVTVGSTDADTFNVLANETFTLDVAGGETFTINAQLGNNAGTTLALNNTQGGGTATVAFTDDDDGAAGTDSDDSTTNITVNNAVNATFNGGSVGDTATVTVNTGGTATLGAGVTETIGTLAGAGTLTLGAGAFLVGDTSTFTGVQNGTGSVTNAVDGVTQTFSIGTTSTLSNFTLRNDAPNDIVSLEIDAPFNTQDAMGGGQATFTIEGDTINANGGAVRNLGNDLVANFNTGNAAGQGVLFDGASWFVFQGDDGLGDLDANEQTNLTGNSRIITDDAGTRVRLEGDINFGAFDLNVSSNVANNVTNVAGRDSFVEINELATSDFTSAAGSRITVENAGYLVVNTLRDEDGDGLVADAGEQVLPSIEVLAGGGLQLGTSLSTVIIDDTETTGGAVVINGGGVGADPAFITGVEVRSVIDSTTFLRRDSLGVSSGDTTPATSEVGLDSDAIIIAGDSADDDFAFVTPAGGTPPIIEVSVLENADDALPVIDGGLAAGFSRPITGAFAGNLNPTLGAIADADTWTIIDVNGGGTITLDGAAIPAGVQFDAGGFSDANETAELEFAYLTAPTAPRLRSESNDADATDEFVAGQGFDGVAGLDANTIDPAAVDANGNPVNGAFVEEDLFADNVLRFGWAISDDETELILVADRAEQNYSSSDFLNQQFATIGTSIGSIADPTATQTNINSFDSDGTRLLDPTNPEFFTAGNTNNDAALLINRIDNLTENPFATLGYNNAVHEIYDGARAYGQAAAVVTHLNERINLQHNEYIAARMSGNAALAQVANGGDFFAAAESGLLNAAYDDYNAQYGPGSSGRLDSDPWNVYVRGFGIFEEQDDTADVTGYDADGGGVTAGIDYAFNDNFLLGIYFTYNATEIELDNSLGDIDIDTYRFGPYLGLTFGDFFVDIQTSFGFSEQESDRNSPILGFSNNADYDAFDFTFFAGVGYNFRFDQFVITPEFQIQYTYYDQDSFSESGAGGLSIDEYEANLINTRLGANFAYVFETGGITWIPEVTVGWDFEAGDDLDEVTGNFNAGGVPFEIETDLGDESSVYIGAGFTALLENNVAFFARFDGQYTGDQSVSSVGGGLSFRF